MKVILASAILLLPLALGEAHAADTDGVDCKNAVAQNDLNICADRDFQKADALLNKTYKETTNGMDAQTLDLLRKSQRAWLAFRDAECTYLSATNQGGSIYPMVYSGCLTRLTKLRTEQLKQGDNE
jgi:uncharacterized protein YecT (DUF1311 family)